METAGSTTGRTWKASPDPVVTDTADVDERYAHLAAYGDGLLAGWSEETDLTLAVLDAAGSIGEGPVAVSAEAGGLDDFASYPNGDVG